MSDLYPGLKLLMKFNLPETLNDRSLRPILQQRLKAVSMTSQAAFSNQNIPETDVTSNSVGGENRVLSVEKIIAADRIDIPEAKTVEQQSPLYTKKINYKKSQALLHTQQVLNEKKLNANARSSAKFDGVATTIMSPHSLVSIAKTSKTPKSGYRGNYNINEYHQSSSLWSQSRKKSMPHLQLFDNKKRNTQFQMQMQTLYTQQNKEDEECDATKFLLSDQLNNFSDCKASRQAKSLNQRAYVHKGRKFRRRHIMISTPASEICPQVGGNFQEKLKNTMRLYNIKPPKN